MLFPSGDMTGLPADFRPRTSLKAGPGTLSACATSTAQTHKKSDSDMMDFFIINLLKKLFISIPSASSSHPQPQEYQDQHPFSTQGSQGFREFGFQAA